MKLMDEPSGRPLLMILSTGGNRSGVSVTRKNVPFEAYLEKALGDSLRANELR